MNPAVKERPLRVVYLGHSAALSGAELGLVELIGALHDVEAHVLLAEDGPLVERLRARGAAVDVLALGEQTRRLRRASVRPGAPALGPAALATVAYAWRLGRRLRSLRPDLVHANTLKAFVYGAIAARLARTPLVWHVHDRIADDYLTPAAVRFLRAAAPRAACGVIANSDATLATLARPRLPAAVVHEPVAASAVAEPTPSRDRPFTAAMVGRLAPWKGQDVFLRAFARAFPDGPERAIIVGSALFGEHAYAASLERLVGRLGLAGRVELRGFRDDVAAELAAADALVHASVIAEPFGRVVIEGMAAGLPVVAAGAGGPAEVIADGVDGLLYPPGDADALAAAIARLAGDPALRGRLAAAGRLRARSFSPEAAAAQTSLFYRRVLEERAA